MIQEIPKFQSAAELHPALPDSAYVHGNGLMIKSETVKNYFTRIFGDKIAAAYHQQQGNGAHVVQEDPNTLTFERADILVIFTSGDWVRIASENLAGFEYSGEKEEPAPPPKPVPVYFEEIHQVWPSLPDDISIGVNTHLRKHVQMGEYLKKTFGPSFVCIYTNPEDPAGNEVGNDAVVIGVHGAYLVFEGGHIAWLNSQWECTLSNENKK